MSNTKLRLLLPALVLLLILGNLAPVEAQSSIKGAAKSGLPAAQIKQIERFVKQRMKAGKIPGLGLVIVKGNQVAYQKGFGYADLRTKSPVTPDTFFELGSNSKAFTALGILCLRDQGLLRLTDPVNKYLPWFYMKYEGKKATITIEQLLHQTSGVPFTSIGAIPVSEADDALEKTVKTLVGKELAHKPGESFLYATINYDVLGLIIQQVSGQSYEKYMEINVLQPLGLHSTFLFRQDALNHGMIATGYKTGFMQPLEYKAPRYRGNTPAGYFISNLGDVGKWLMIQLGTGEKTSFNPLLIQEAHIPDETVRPGGDGSFYGMGWWATRVNGKMISHGGANPNFQSYIILKPDQKTAVALLTNRGNIEAADTQFICQGILDLVEGLKPKTPPANTSQGLDGIASIVFYISIALIVSLLWMIILALIGLFKKERRFQSKGLKGWIELLVSLVLVAQAGYCLYIIPDMLVQGSHWDFIEVWGPISIVYGVILALGAIIMFVLHYLVISYFPKPDEKPYFSLAILSIVSGLGNAFIIFTVNAALDADSKHFPTTLLVYFLMAIIIYVFGSRIVRKRMITITNDIVFFKRITLIKRILKASYQKLEALEDGKIQAGLNNDTEVISGFANLLIGGVTSFITLLCCFVYLGLLNIYGLLISAVVIGIAAGLFFYVSGSANKLWEQTRDIQNRFFKFINDLTGGFKELYGNTQKQDDFAADMQQTCKSYRDKRLEGEFKFINVFVVGELLFTLVIATVAFTFRRLFPSMNVTDLRTYIFIFLYMTGPVHGVLNTIPGITQFRISWKRINQLLDEIAMIKLEAKQDEIAIGNQNVSIQLEDVVFSYKTASGEEFTVGPVSAGFTSGEITFITGGNGSGKSTLAKLITGLYVPDQGSIKLNGVCLSPHSLSQNYSTVFSDFYLFEKLYGVDYQDKQEVANNYLKLLRIEDKAQISDGVFSTIKLSTGQKKRLALLVCFLEDRPIYLFDEWAADQDVEFRKFFYHVLLPQLRERGKCVIAISHDDRYFPLADQLIKMEMGQIVETKKNTPGVNVETA